MPTTIASGTNPPLARNRRRWSRWLGIGSIRVTSRSARKDPASPPALCVLLSDAQAIFCRRRRAKARRTLLLAFDDQSLARLLAAAARISSKKRSRFLKELAKKAEAVINDKSEIDAAHPPGLNMVDRVHRADVA